MLNKRSFRQSLYLTAVITIALTAASSASSGQQNVPPAAPPRPLAYPDARVGSPEATERGKQLFSANCSFCHGSDARGGETGPNLLRSETILNDKDGELIAPVVLNGRIDKGMPKFDLSPANISDLATFIHSQHMNNRGAVTIPVSILVGDAKAGEAFFNGEGKCATCHSTTGDLAGIGKNDPRVVQNAFISGGKFLSRGTSSKIPPSRVTVTLASGQSIKGILKAIDDFNIVLMQDDGHYRSFSRQGNVPKVDVSNPIQAHIDMYKTITDEQIHNMTSYLVTIK